MRGFIKQKKTQTTKKTQPHKKAKKMDNIKGENGPVENGGKLLQVENKR